MSFLIKVFLIVCEICLKESRIELIQASQKLELINKTTTITILSLIRITKSSKSIKIIPIQFSSRVPLKNTQILLDKVCYSLLSIPLLSAQDWYFFDFLQRLSSARIDYQTWYVEKLYFPYQHYYSLREEAAYLIFSQGALEHMQKLDWSFFCQFKAYYHANLVSNKWNILAQLLNKKQLQNPEAFIADLSLQRIQSFFAQKI